MGRKRLRVKDIAIASSKRWRDPNLGDYKTASPMIAHCRVEARSFGVRIVHKVRSSLRMSKVSTAYYRQIRLGTDYETAQSFSQAATMAHEMVHVRQWRYYGRLGFAWRYVMSPRFRWAVECNAFAEGVRALRILGIHAAIGHEVHTRATQMRGPYRLRSINESDLVTQTRKILARSGGI